MLVLAGERDERFSALGRRIAHTIGSNAVFALVPGAGHAAHLEEPEAFLRVLRDFSMSGAQGQSEREERAEAELQATGPGQDTDQPAVCVPLRTRLIGPTARGYGSERQGRGPTPPDRHASAPMKASAASAP